MISTPLELGVRSDVAVPLRNSAPSLHSLAASAKEIGAMLFLDDIGTMLSIAGASFAGVVACSGLLLLLA